MSHSPGELKAASSKVISMRFEEPVIVFFVFLFPFGNHPLKTKTLGPRGVESGRP